MSRPAPRRAVVAAAVVGCVAAAAVPAFAATAPSPGLTGSPSSTVVSLSSTGVGGRQLSLLDLAGNPLTSVALRPGVPSPFRVKVSDTSVGQLDLGGASFSVSAVLNNLYNGGNASSSFIPARDVTVGFPAGGARDAAGSLIAEPKTLLAGALPTCLGAGGLLSLPGLSTLSALTGAGLSLCNAVGSGLSVGGLTVPLADQTLNNLLDVPFALGGQTSGAFNNADYANGIGAADTRGSGAPTATPRTLLTGTPQISSTLQTTLNTLTSGLQALPAVSATGSGAQTSVPDVIAQMLAPANSGLGLGALGSALAALTPAQAATVLSQLTGTVQTLGLGDVLGLTGVYNSYPVLTATPSTAPAAGTYSGTMTVTLVQP